MSFTIIKNLEELPSYAMLCKMAGQNQLSITGDEQTGAFSRPGVEGGFEFREGVLRGKFAAHGVKGEFSFETGQATVIVIERPFWLPETLLKRKITEGMDALWRQLIT